MSDNVNIVVDSGKMRSVARVIDNQKSIIMSCFASIRDDVNVLKSRDWEGDSADAYIKCIDKIINDQLGSDTITTGNVMQILKGYLEILNNTAAAFEKTEQKQEDRVNELRTEIFNV
jgi:uncharacterized protein YukE